MDASLRSNTQFADLWRPLVESASCREERESERERAGPVVMVKHLFLLEPKGTAADSVTQRRTRTGAPADR